MDKNVSQGISYKYGLKDLKKHKGIIYKLYNIYINVKKRTYNANVLKTEHYISMMTEHYISITIFQVLGSAVIRTHNLPFW